LTKGLSMLEHCIASVALPLDAHVHPSPRESQALLSIIVLRAVPRDIAARQTGPFLAIREFTSSVWLRRQKQKVE
jgi:hypothetical protein